ncbi:HNH endonuclease signature motif containing protein [Mycolicibacterium stellerae]|uniref:HNH endonuclease signature motif containing protein n=1 Tax=Mycolicibacterium stellerae TaxID=2358193 RepID=UPI000F0BD9F7|nr:HNH endonuclease signature motif containing protein [Mycolicibacterium stellerae]
MDIQRDEIRAALDAVDTGYARLRAACSDSVGNAFRVEVAERLETQHRVNRGLMYRFFGELMEPPDGPDDPDLPAGTVMSKLLWKRLRITTGEVKRRIALAARIRPRRTLTGPVLPPELPCLAAAVEAGALGDDHIRAVCGGIDLLPSALGHKKDTCERILVRHANDQDANFVKSIGKGIAEHLNPDELFDDTDRARRRGLTLGPQQPDGLSRVHGWVDPEMRAYIEAGSAAVRPGRHRPAEPESAEDAQPDHADNGESASCADDFDNPEPDSDAEDLVVPPGSDPTAEHAENAELVDGAGHVEVTPDPRNARQRLHDALKLGLRAGLASGAYGQHRGLPVTVIATVTLSELNQAARAVNDPSIPMPPPARTGGGSRLPMRDLIRLAANSIHYLAVFDDHSNRPLYLGRTKRIASADQRIICYARDRGCTRPGCTEPGYHCEVNHDPSWAAGGRTDADCLFFDCGPDHTLISKGLLQTKVTDTGRLAYSDGNGPFEVNLAHHPEELLRELFESDDGPNGDDP